ncbi:SDR family oxidoreductase [Paracoccus endophyticus]|uniref:SDR family oxidoreductase n=1 Tax=Paracoccus endophyticus TaxID=2233774 RepID=UPI000DDBDFC6|nr:SDR family oxidoreductase [Paracoccus endophyticus]
MTDRTIIITGAGSGIGRVTAQLFLDKGWRVGLVGRREAALAETAAGRDGALVLPCDVTDEGDVDAAFARAAAGWGRLDVLFNNAGANVPPRGVDETTLADWRSVIDVNVTGMFLCARAAFRQMRAQTPQGGRIINNGSISAYVPRPGMVAYTVSKHAVTGLTRTLSLEGRPFGIACGQIDIGNALTDMAAAQTKGVTQADGSVRVEPVMDAAEVARAVLHMAGMPEGANVQFMTVMATNMPYIGRG